MVIRALLRSAKVVDATAPYDTLALKIFYPALAGDEVAREAGVLPADPTGAPYPVIVFLPGVNMGAEQYQWLAVALAQRGIITLLYNWIAENFPGRVSYTPGLNLQMLTPATYGAAPSASALPALLAALDALQADSVLAGLLNLKRVFLGGHSAGGSLALMNADPKFFPQVAGAFAYCSNLLATAALGKFTVGELPCLPSALPMLLLGATEDGIGNHHNEHFGRPGQTGAHTLAQTFETALTGGGGDHYLAILRGANHHTLAHPLDDTIGRTYLDLPTRADEPTLRALLANLIGDFVGGANLAEKYVRHELIADLRKK